MVVKEKTREKDQTKTTEKDNVDLVKEITDMLWTYDSIKHVVRNNYVVLQSVVRNVVKSLGINADNFDIEAFNDNFDIHEIDTQSHDTLSYSLSKLLSKFIVNKSDNNAELLMEMAPYEIANRLSEVLKYLKENPNDNETVDYAKELINQLREFDRGLASKYSRELESIVNPKPMVVETEPKPVVRVIESKPVEPRTKTVKHNVDNDRAKKIENIETILKHYIAYVRAPSVGKYDNTPIYVEKAKELIEKLRELNPQLAGKYERELNTVLYEKRKYANYGKKEPKAKVRIRHASVRITKYFNANETESDKRELVSDVNAVDVDKILRPTPRPRSVKTDVKSNKTTVRKQKPGLLYRIRQLQDIIGKDFVYMYYYRRRY